jgi:nucleoside diphosphate kinase
VVSVRVSAKHDVAEAEDWYEEREPGLGIRFRAEVFRVIGSAVVVMAVIHGKRGSKHVRTRLTGA